MKSAEIREAFLKFFQSKGHTAVPSSSLVPQDDPTLLFTNAGMNQFKDCFLGLEQRGYTRATSTQKCVRAGGKHNDLENVGYTARHHTFFEMLGNFSFGDYFKKDAIHYAWEFLTGVLKLPAEKLWITVYASDDEAYDIWNQQIGVPAERIIRIGDNKGAPYASDNFWAMGDTGPCGPCTEIFYDHGEEVWGGPPGSPEEDGDRYIEIWNVVFMQYNRSADGEMNPLPAPSVDTGMGLERVSAVLQGVHANYEIDLFQNLLQACAQAIGCENNDEPSLRVVADHIRSCSFLIADGVLPSNEGRGYVLRRIIRRACRHGHKLGAEGSFFYKLVPALVAEMGAAFPELKKHQAHIEKNLRLEEEQFAKTLKKGLDIFEKELLKLAMGSYSVTRHINFDTHRVESDFSLSKLIAFTVETHKKYVFTMVDSHDDIQTIINHHKLNDDAAKIILIAGKLPHRKLETIYQSFDFAESQGNIDIELCHPELLPPIPGEIAFKLYDTYGFPLDLTADIARERSLRVDEEGFEKEMQNQRERARSASQFGVDYNAAIKIDRATEFTGYTAAEGQGSILALYKEGQPVDVLNEGEEGLVILDRTPFYAESGGQVGDCGQLLASDSRFDVRDTTKAGEAHVHHGLVAEGSLKKGQTLTAKVDNSIRHKTRLNHSATHLLHAALRQVLGEGVQQKGSLVDSQRLRFDFSHPEAVKPEELAEIQQLVNAQIRANAATQVELMDLDTAKARGAMALFGEKYSDEVRVLTMGTREAGQPFSIELCGGLHVERTGDIALMHITSEAGIASGIRRIEAITGEAALNYLLNREQQLEQAAAQLKAKPEHLLERLESNQERTRQLEKEVQQLKKKLASGVGGTDLTADAKEVGGIKLLATQVEGADMKTLRELMDQLKQKLAPAVVVLAAIEGNKVSLVAGTSGEAKDRLHAGKLVNHVAQQVGGKGGGRPDMAQAGGTDTAALPGALASVHAWVAEQLGQD